MNPRDWEQTPACAGMPHLFFTIGSGSYQPGAGWVREAKQLCAQCPVLSECRQWNDAVEGQCVDLARLDGIYAGETPSERVNRRRGQRRPGAARTHCINGHPWTAETTYVNSNGHRQCVECRRESGRQYRRRHRQAVGA